MITATDVIDRMDGWSNVQVNKYDSDTEKYELVWEDSSESAIPDEYGDLAVEVIHIYGNTLVLDCDEQ